MEIKLQEGQIVLDKNGREFRITEGDKLVEASFSEIDEFVNDNYSDMFNNGGMIGKYVEKFADTFLSKKTRVDVEEGDEDYYNVNFLLYFVDGTMISYHAYNEDYRDGDIRDGIYPEVSANDGSTSGMASAFLALEDRLEKTKKLQNKTMDEFIVALTSKDYYKFN